MHRQRSEGDAESAGVLAPQSATNVRKFGQVRTLEQVRQVLAGTQALRCRVTRSACVVARDVDALIGRWQHWQRRWL